MPHRGLGVVPGGTHKRQRCLFQTGHPADSQPPGSNVISVS
jgi:hypothetical protein